MEVKSADDYFLRGAGSHGSREDVVGDIVNGDVIVNVVEGSVMIDVKQVGNLMVGNLSIGWANSHSSEGLLF